MYVISKNIDQLIGGGGVIVIGFTFNAYDIFYTILDNYDLKRCND